MGPTQVKQVIRSLARRPGYTLVAVLTLGVGLGVSTAIFSLLHGAFLRPLPYPDAERLVRVHNVYQASGGGGPFATPNYVDVVRQNRTLEELVGYSVSSVNLSTEEEPSRIRALSVTDNFFDGLGVRPAVGRGFQEGEDREGAEPVAVIGHRLWQDHFGGSRDAVGRTLRLNGEAYTVVGILPESFWFVGDPAVITPFSWGESALADGNRGNRWLSAFGRLAPGVEAPAVQADVGAILDRIAAEFPNNNQGWAPTVEPFSEYVLGGSRTSLLLLVGASLLVLLIGCANVANLMLVRGERRRREMALRTALGAGRGTLAGTFLLESVTLSVVAGLAGVGIAAGGMRLFLGLYGSSLPRAASIELSGPVLLFALGLTLLTGLLVGLMPALRVDTGRLQEVLREGGGGATSSGTRLQRVLVGGEVAVAVMLVAGAALLVHSFWKLNRVDTGVVPEGAMVFRVDLPAAGAYASDADVVGFYRSALAELERLPQVEHVGISPRVPLRGGSNITTLTSPDDPELTASFVEIRQVTPGFFPAAGIPLVRGRLLDESDATADNDVVVISDVVADAIFPDGNALGKRILQGWNGTGWEVVGIVGSVREFGVTRDKRPALYWSYPPPSSFGRPSSSMTFVVRTGDDDPLAIVPQVREIVAGLDPDLPLYGIRSLEDVVVETVGSRWFATKLFVGFGALALALAGLGIFGVLAYTVQQRTREIGIRMALGASRRLVTRSVILDGVRLVSFGLLVGLVGAYFASELLSSLLYEVQPTHAPTLAAVAVVAIAAGAVASYLPARRAARLEPMSALRTE